MNISEMFQAVDLLSNEWNLGKKESMAKGKICAWIYLMEILEETEFLEMHKENNKLIGFCGYSKWSSKKNKFRKKFYNIIKNMLLKSSAIKNKEAIKKYLQDYNYTPKELKTKFDGEISILIVDKKYRGRGIGKKLLLTIFEKAKKDNMTNLQILSDEACNFKIYEICGCKKVYETIIPNGEPDKVGNEQTEMGYIYEKLL